MPTLHQAAAQERSESRLPLKLLIRTGRRTGVNGGPEVPRGGERTTEEIENTARSAGDWRKQLVRQLRVMALRDTAVTTAIMADLIATEPWQKASKELDTKLEHIQVAVAQVGHCERVAVTLDALFETGFGGI
eukprot:Hpha_TRINITY_DN15751_c2_g2::TRINITY_DN15751_c2_g2_i1::g.40842::m.40842